MRFRAVLETQFSHQLIVVGYWCVLEEGGKNAGMEDFPNLQPIVSEAFLVCSLNGFRNDLTGKKIIKGRLIGIALAFEFLDGVVQQWCEPVHRLALECLVIANSVVCVVLD